MSPEHTGSRPRQAAQLSLEAILLDRTPEKRLSLNGCGWPLRGPHTEANTRVAVTDSQL
jgi:hypothetical protein